MALSPKVQIAVLADNMESQRKEIDRLSRIRLSYLDDGAHIAEDYLLSSMQNGIITASALTDLSERCREKGNLFKAETDFFPLTLDDRFVFAELLTRRLLLADRRFSASLLPERGVGGRVAYVRHSIANRAFDFAKECFGMKEAVFVSDFKEACEAVLNGDADYCLLPYSENGFVPILSIFDTALQSDLLCSLLLESGDVSYALYGKRILPLPNEGQVFLQFSYQKEKQEEMKLSEPVRESLCQCFTCGKGAQQSVINTLKITGKDSLLTCLLYFRLFYPDVKMIGYMSLSQI